MAEGPLWTPSFIDVVIWEQAVSNFKMSEKLDRNVAKYLLPQMDEYLQNIPDTELISMTRDFLIEHGVIHSPISQQAKKTYYFNEREVYSCDEREELFPYEGRIKRLFDVGSEICFNKSVWRNAVNRYQPEIYQRVIEKIEIVTGTLKGASGTIPVSSKTNDEQSWFRHNLFIKYSLIPMLCRTPA